ncbi:MAG: TetR/AcrR family transcriptional regulator, partial [Pseudomonadota bacterium]|nr:TetR/AcrR family transcriptional regulator [Pseudomonadota bacterium]
MAVWRNTIPSRDELYEAKREVLLREAASAFNRHGFHATSLDDIAQRLGLTKAALYHYFPSKQTLLSACFTRAMEVAFASLDRARGEGGTGRDTLRRTVSYYL